MGARLEREDKTEKKADTWAWTDNPFVHTRELDGLLVMMALINNWDLKTENNKAYAEDKTELRYVVADLGASFGRTGAVTTRSKGNLADYQKAKFIKYSNTEYVDFVMRTKPSVFPEAILREKLWQAQKDGDLRSPYSASRRQVDGPTAFSADAPADRRCVPLGRTFECGGRRVYTSHVGQNCAAQCTLNALGCDFRPAFSTPDAS